MAEKSTSPLNTYIEDIKLWQSQKFEPELTSYDLLLKENPVMDIILNAGPSLIIIADMRTSEYVHVTRNCEQLLGYTAEEIRQAGMEHLVNLIHPEDIDDYKEAVKVVWEFLLALPAEKRKYYKTSADFRVKVKAGAYKRVLQQNTPLQTDKAGNIVLLLMVFTDISHLNHQKGVSAAIISTENDGYLVWEARDTQLKKQLTFSRREREIIKLLAEGFSSKQIAETLHLSEYTVSTHRRNMLDKTNLPNARALVNFAISRGMF
jgi:DNA-binding CsgD family transcriptional regulator